MPRKKINEENIEMIDKQDTSSIKEQEQKAENKEIAQINMNNVAYAAFLEFRKNGKLYLYDLVKTKKETSSPPEQ